MAKYEFTLVLTEADVTDEQADAICAAGCDDGFIVTRNDVTRNDVTQVNFYREASSLEQAIKSATDDLRKAGVHVARVELDPHLLVTA